MAERDFSEGIKGQGFSTNWFVNKNEMPIFYLILLITSGLSGFQQIEN